MLGGKVRLPLGHPYDFAFGLGQNCANAAYMSGWNLRLCSSPFDWLDGSRVGLAKCVDLIESRFADFLLKDELVRLENPMREMDDRNCDYYRDGKTGFLVMHDFPRNVPLDESYPKVIGKYRRRIERLYRRVAEARRTIFIYWARFESLPPERLAPLAQRLRSVFPGRAVDLLVIEHDPSADGIASVSEVLEGVVRVTGRFFVDRSDNLVMGDEKLNGRVYGAVPKTWGFWLIGLRRDVLRTLICIVSAFCPDRVKRHAFRRRWTEALLGKELV